MEVFTKGTGVLAMAKGEKVMLWLFVVCRWGTKVGVRWEVGGVRVVGGG